MTRSTRGALIAIGVGAAVLRFWGIGYGLPHPASRPDEDLVMAKSVRIALDPTADPRDFNYSHGVYYLHAAALISYRMAGQLLGRYRDAKSFLDDVEVGHPGLQYRICRASSAVLGSLTALVAAWAAWEGYRRRSTALLAGALVAVNFLHVRDSHFATVDVPMALLATAALGFSLRAAGTQARRDYVLAGLFGGLATSAKYNAATIAFAIVASAAPGLLRRDRRWRAVGDTLLAGATMIAAFSLTSPYCVLRLHDFLVGVAVQKHELFDGWGEPGWHVHLTMTLPGAFGLVGFGAAALGIGRALWLRRRADLVLLAFVAATFASLAAITWSQARYMVPLVPPLAILAAEATTALGPLGRGWMVAAGLALTLQPLENAVAFDRLAARDDTRLQATRWIADHIPSGARIGACAGYGAPTINEDPRRPPAFDRVTMACSSRAVLETAPRYVVVHNHPDIAFFAPSEEFQEALRARGRLLVEFNPLRNAKGMRRCFYQTDAFYIPYCRFDSVDRGGPIVAIWDLGEREPLAQGATRVGAAAASRRGR